MFELEIPWGSLNILASTQQFYGDTPTMTRIACTNVTWNINDFVSPLKYACMEPIAHQKFSNILRKKWSKPQAGFEPLCTLSSTPVVAYSAHHYCCCQNTFFIDLAYYNTSAHWTNPGLLTITIDTLYIV